MTKGSQKKETDKDNKTTKATKQTGTGTKESPIKATVVGTAHVITGSADEWGTVNYGGVQFLNLGADAKDVEILQTSNRTSLLNAQEIFGKNIGKILEHILQQNGGGPICK